MKKDDWFSGKIALITGATSGIGREIAKQLASSSCKVLACGKENQAMDSLLEELNKISSFRPEGFVFDLSDKNSRQEYIKKISENHKVDILINNAGFGNMNDFHSMPENLMRQMEEVNMAAVVDLCHKFLPKMVERRKGGILNVGSTASFFATPGSALYGATKHFVLGLTDALHQEVLNSGVHISGLYPGHTYTRFIDRATNGKIKNWNKAMSPEQVAKLGLNGLAKNKIRVICGFDNKIKIWASYLMPISYILRRIYNKAVKRYKT